MRIQNAYTRFDPETRAAGAKVNAERGEHGDKRVAGEAIAPTAEPTAATQVKLSSRAQELAARASRIDALRESVQSGSYKVDAEKIAAKLVGDE